MRFVAPLIFFISLSSTAFAEDYPLVVPCADDLRDIAHETVYELDSALDEAVALVEGQDFLAQALAIKWLGARNKDDADTVAEVLSAARGMTEAVAFLCIPLTDYKEGPGGTEETFAFVYGETPVVYLYGNFFDLSKTGENSRVGTLLHELAHLDFVASANASAQEVYETSEILELAKEDPEAALRNAESYARFVEALMYGGWSDVQ